MAKNPDPNLKLTSTQGRDAHARRLVDDVPPLPRDPAAASRGRGVHPDREAHLPGVRRRRLSHRVLRRRQRVHRARRARRRREPSTSRSSIPTRSSSPVSGSRTFPRSCTCVRTRRSSPPPKDGTRRVAAGRERGGEVDGVERADRRGDRRSAAHARLAGLIGDALTCDHAVTNAQCWHRARGFARVPASPYRGDPLYGCVVVGCQCCSHRRVQQGPKRPTPEESPYEPPSISARPLLPRHRDAGSTGRHRVSRSPIRSATSRPRPHSSKRRSAATPRSSAR